MSAKGNPLIKKSKLGGEEPFWAKWRNAEHWSAAAEYQSVMQKLQKLFAEK
jgi:hypothetical protein